MKFKNHSNRANLRQSFNALTFELKRLQKLGYKPKDLYQKIQTAETVHDMLERLQELTATTIEDQQELDSLVASMNEGELSTMSLLTTRIGVALEAPLPISTEMKLELAKEIMEDRMYKEEFARTKSTARDEDTVYYASSLEHTVFNTPGWEIMTWQHRSILLNDRMLVVKVWYENPAAAETITKFEVHDKTEKPVTEVERTDLLEQHLNILTYIAMLKSLDPAANHRDAPEYAESVTDKDGLDKFKEKLETEYKSKSTPLLLGAIASYDGSAAQKASESSFGPGFEAFQELSTNLDAYNAANPSGHPEKSGQIIGKQSHQMLFFDNAGKLQQGEMSEYKVAMEVKKKSEFSEVRTAFAEHASYVDFDTEIKPKLTARIAALDAQRAEGADLLPAYRAKFEAAIDARIARTITDLQKPRVLKGSRTREIRLKIVKVQMAPLVALQQDFTDLRTSTAQMGSPDIRAHYEQRIDKLESRELGEVIK